MLLMAGSQGVLRALAVALYGSLAGAIYLPGFAPKEYAKEELVDLKVNKLLSVKTQLPYSYYYLAYCRPHKGIKDSIENLGETLMGDMIQNSPYEIKMLVNENCKKLCTVPLTGEDKDKFKSMIEDDYQVNWIVDNLPAATREWGDGFRVGTFDQGKHYLHNHVSLELSYHQDPAKYEGYRIVGVHVQPNSVKHSPDLGSGGCDIKALPGLNLDELTDESVTFTYDVVWSWSDVRWASRWDNYLQMRSGLGKIHWFAILNSLMILLFLSGMVAMILLRTLHRDIAKYNELATAEEVREESGWKLVHGDVFRTPEYSAILAVSVGSGMQLLCMSILTLIFAVLGLLSPARRGGLLQTMMLLFTLMGVFAGYVAGRMIKLFDGDASRWKSISLLTAFLYPGLFFLVFFLLNLFIWGEKSSGAVPFTTMFALLVLWFGVSVPLVLLGSHAGFRKEPIELPVLVSKLPREVPEHPWFVHPAFTCLLGGVLPFGAVFTELFFIMASIWLHQFYYLFGFLALVLVILLVTCAEISIAMTYFHLTAEDHRWWWISFSASASSAIYVFLYSILFFSNNLHLQGFVGKLLYIGYMSTASVMFSLLTGSIGCISSFFFVRVIYGSIKID